MLNINERHVLFRHRLAKCLYEYPGSTGISVFIINQYFNIQGLDQTLEAIPSHTELDVAMENINETLNILNMGEFPPSDRSYG